MEALLYLHTPAGAKGCVIHRDFKPENILLDEHLHAYLADTGFAKSERPEATTARSTHLVLTYGYLDPGVIQGGQASTATDGYAVGITLLVVLTGRSPLQIIEKCEEETDADFEDLDAARLVEADAGWPAHVARAIAPLVLCREESLCHHKPRKRVSLATVLQALQKLVGAPQMSPSDQVSPSDGAASSETRVAGSASALTPLSVQVRGLRHGAAAETDDASVQRNVSEAFDNFVRRLDQLYASGGAAPSDFETRIHYWRDRCGLPRDVHSRLQRLRIWRNASLHHDSERWQREGPRSVAEASQHIATLETAICQL